MTADQAKLLASNMHSANRVTASNDPLKDRDAGKRVSEAVTSLVMGWSAIKVARAFAMARDS